MGKETVTYIPYREGQDAKHLHLGNLVHDPRNPKFYDPYVEKSYTDISETAPEWIESTALENYAITVGQDSDDPNKFQVVAAAKATKIELKDPTTFFKSTTLSPPEAKKWLTLRLSATELLPSSSPKPEIWILTGLIVMPHATWTTISTTASQKGEFTPGLRAPFDPSGVTNIRRLSVSDNVRPVIGHKDEPKKHISGAEIVETGKYPGLRGWAARWEKVQVEVLPAEKWKDDVGNLKLRLEEGTRKFAKVDVKRGGEYAVWKRADDDDDGGFTDAFWEEFLDDVDDEE